MSQMLYPLRYRDTRGHLVTCDTWLALSVLVSQRLDHLTGKQEVICLTSVADSGFTLHFCALEKLNTVF